MKDEILAQLTNPGQLEKMYRANKAGFKRAFSVLYPQVKGNAIADVWNERLNYEGEDISWGSSKDLMLLLVASLLAGLIAKIPQFFGLSEDFFYPRNVGFVVLPLLTAYFAYKNKLSTGKVAFVIGASLAGLLFINLFPQYKNSDTLTLSCIALPVFLWSVLGFAFVGDIKNTADKRLNFLKYNGDLVVMTTLILIAGALLSGITVGLFSLIGFEAREFYFKNVAIFGLAAAPIVGTYLSQTNPQLVGKVSPVIAKLFSPLVAVMLTVYLVAMIYSRKNPYNDREFLLIFNALLVGVMAIIFFSVAETSPTSKKHTQIWVLLALSALTIVVNSVALSAILFRITEWGFTPNRTAVLGVNMLILVNLLLVARQILRVLTNKTEIASVGKTIAFYLPVYFIWVVIVTFIFPLIFGFK
jgi:hypothetical protein